MALGYLLFGDHDVVVVIALEISGLDGERFPALIDVFLFWAASHSVEMGFGLDGQLARGGRKVPVAGGHIGLENLKKASHVFPTIGFGDREPPPRQIPGLPLLPREILRKPRLSR